MVNSLQNSANTLSSQMMLMWWLDKIRCSSHHHRYSHYFLSMLIMHGCPSDDLLQFSILLIPKTTGPPWVTWQLQEQRFTYLGQVTKKKKKKTSYRGLHSTTSLFGCSSKVFFKVCKVKVAFPSRWVQGDGFAGDGICPSSTWLRIAIVFRWYYVTQPSSDGLHSVFWWTFCGFSQINQWLLLMQ